MLALRVITALVLAPLFLAGIFLLPSDGFAAFIGLFLVLSAWEWGGLCGFAAVGRALLMAGLALAAALAWRLGLELPLAIAGSAFWLLALVAVLRFPAGLTLWQRPLVRALAGLFMLLPAWAGLTLLQARDGGAWLVLWTMVLVWGADIGAYFSGRAFGRRKLAPQVSPGKTLEGLAGGMAAALLLSLAIAAVAGFGLDALAAGLVVSLLVIVASVVGDLMESLVKRVAGVKDSGNLLPGHGGVLDRVDAVLAAAPLAALLLTLLDVVPGGWLAQWS
ncbi:MAG TPA: phosphatidate cytidylyltransferase [Pseudomonadales bacterium]|nr:phosphatidate cytidylyltransferase [Pseudomonadales bacterium]